MLRVRTEVKPLSNNRLGLFAAEFIAKGQITWAFDEGIDLQLPVSTLEALPRVQRDFLIQYGFFNDDGSVLFHCADDLRYINHSSEPNIKSALFEDRALRDIMVGEELVCDFRDYEPDWFERRGLDPSALL